MPIRVPGRPPGGGPAIVLPEGGVVREVALGRTIQAATGTVAGLASEQVKRQDHLNFVREGAQLNTQLSAGLQSLDVELDEFAESPEYTEEAYAARRAEGLNRVFAESRAALSDQRLIAQVDGQLQGLLESDLGADFERIDLARDTQAIERTGQEATDVIGGQALENISGTVGAASSALDQIVRDRPELLSNVEQEKARILRSIKTRYIQRSGAAGEARYLIDLLSGEFDGLGSDTISGEVSRAPGRLPFVLNEVSRQSFQDDQYGQETRGQGQFSRYSPNTDVLELAAIGLEAEGLPEGPLKTLVQASMRGAIQTKQARSRFISQVADWANGVGPLPNVAGNEQAEKAFDFYFNQQLVPWFQDSNVSRDDKILRLTTMLRQVGFYTPAVSSFLKNVIRQPDLNPELTQAIAYTRAFVSPTPFSALNIEFSDEKRFEQLRGRFPLNIKDVFNDDEKAFLNDVVRLSDIDAPTAVTDALRLRESRGESRSVASRGRSSGEDSAGLDFLPPETREELKEDASTLTEFLLDQGADLTGTTAGERFLRGFGRGLTFRLPKGDRPIISENVEAQFRSAWEAEFVRLDALGLSPAQAARDAKFVAADRVLKANPVVPLFGRAFIQPNLGRLGTPKMIERELIEIFQKNGLDLTKGNLSQRFILLQKPGAPANSFLVWIEADPDKPIGGDNVPQMLKRKGTNLDEELILDADDSVQSRLEDAISVAGMQNSFRIMQKAMGGREPGATQGLDETINQMLVMDRETMRQLSDSYVESVTAGGIPGTAVLPLRGDVSELRGIRTDPDLSLGRPLRTAREEQSSPSGLNASSLLPAHQLLVRELRRNRTLAHRSPRLRAEWERTFEKAKKELPSRLDLRAPGEIPTRDPRVGIGVQSIEEMAAEQANQAVLEIWRQETKGMSVDQKFWLLIDGRLPSEGGNSKPLPAGEAQERLRREEEQEPLSLEDFDRIFGPIQ